MTEEMATAQAGESGQNPVFEQNTEGFMPDTPEELMVLFLEEAEEIIDTLQFGLGRWQAAPKNIQLTKELAAGLCTLKGMSRMIGIVPMAHLSHHLEAVIVQIAKGNVQSHLQLQETIHNSITRLAAQLDAIRSGEPLDRAADLVAQLNDISSA